MAKNKEETIKGVINEDVLIQDTPSGQKRIAFDIPVEGEKHPVKAYRLVDEFSEEGKMDWWKKNVIGKVLKFIGTNVRINNKITLFKVLEIK